MRTVTKACGLLLLSETVPDKLSLVCEWEIAGSINNTAGRKADSKYLLMNWNCWWLGCLKRKD